jgi:hypothetical protein
VCHTRCRTLITRSLCVCHCAVCHSAVCHTRCHTLITTSSLTTCPSLFLTADGRRGLQRSGSSAVRMHAHPFLQPKPWGVTASLGTGGRSVSASEDGGGLDLSTTKRRSRRDASASEDGENLKLPSLPPVNGCNVGGLLCVMRVYVCMCVRVCVCLCICMPQCACPAASKGTGWIYECVYPSVHAHKFD